MSVDQPLVLVIEDDPDIRALVALHLGREGYRVQEDAGRGSVDELLAMSPRPQLIVLDWMLPKTPGIEILRRCRSHADWAGIPVLMLTARIAEADVVRGLEAGADDYVTKPFSVPILLARLHALLRRSKPRAAPVPSDAKIRVGALEIDAARFEAKLDGEILVLTESEFRVLESLGSRAGIVMTRNQLVEKIRGPGFSVTDRTIDNFILSLRRKLGAHESLIQTVRGVGYRLEAPAPRA